MKKSLLLLITLFLSSVMIYGQDSTKTNKKNHRYGKGEHNKEWKKVKNKEREKSRKEDNQYGNGEQKNIKLVEESEDWIKKEDNEILETKKEKNEGEVKEISGERSERGERCKTTEGEKNKVKRKAKGRRNG
jgi:hypothetical protein